MHSSGHRSKTWNISSLTLGNSSSSNSHHTSTLIKINLGITSPSIFTLPKIIPSQVQAHTSTNPTLNTLTQDKHQSRTSWLKVSFIPNMITRMYKMLIGKISILSIIRHFLCIVRRIRRKVISIKAGTVSINVKVKLHLRWLTRKYLKLQSRSMIGCFRLRLSILIPWKVDISGCIMLRSDFLLGLCYKRVCFVIHIPNEKYNSFLYSYLCTWIWQIN